MDSTAATARPRPHGDFAAHAHTMVLLAKGLITRIPGLHNAFRGTAAGGHTQSPSYCYGVWLKHLCLLSKHGLARMPHTVVELGPGNSLGTGFAALLCGAERYVAVDVVRHARASAQLAVFRDLVKRFRDRSPRPTGGWPDFDDCLDERLFPSRILTEPRLRRSLAASRLRRLARAVAQMDRAPTAVRYALWDDPDAVGEGEVDLVFSHAVLCTARDVEAVYRRAARWLRPGGWMSHQTHFGSMASTPEWNGHLRYGPRLWRLMSGGRAYFASQERLSRHVELLRMHGFEQVTLLRAMRYDGLPRTALARPWRTLSDEDLHCESAFIIAQKRRAPDRRV